MKNVVRIIMDSAEHKVDKTIESLLAKNMKWFKPLASVSSNASSLALPAVDYILNGISVEKQSMKVADYVIELNGKQIFCIERKSIRDFHASIRDIRLKSQELRMKSLFTTARMMYILEGDIKSNFKQEDDQYKLYSALISMLIREKISIYRTTSIQHTVEFVIQFAQLLEQKGEDALLSLQVLPQDQLARNVVNPEKSMNYSPLIIYQAILCCIPKLGVNMMSIITAHYPNLPSFIDFLAKLPDTKTRVYQLAHLSLPDAENIHDKSRTRLGPTIAKSICRYLCNDDLQVLNELDIKMKPIKRKKPTMAAATKSEKKEKKVVHIPSSSSSAVFSISITTPSISSSFSSSMLSPSFNQQAFHRHVMKQFPSTIITSDNNKNNNVYTLKIQGQGQVSLHYFNQEQQQQEELNGDGMEEKNIHHIYLVEALSTDTILKYMLHDRLIVWPTRNINESMEFFNHLITKLKKKGLSFIHESSSPNEIFIKELLENNCVSGQDPSIIFRNMLCMIPKINKALSQIIQANFPTMKDLILQLASISVDDRMNRLMYLTSDTNTSKRQRLGPSASKSLCENMFGDVEIDETVYKMTPL